VRPQAELRGISILVDGDELARTAVRDSSAALQILTNLLLNAIEFSPEGSVVTLGVRDTRTSVLYSVSDQGPGIEPERVDTLLSAPASTRRGGAGVGLRHSAALARSHDGDLKITRHSPGACFELRWPIAEARSSARPSAPTKHMLGGVRILVVEDDAAVCALVDLALSARGAEVTIANTRDQFTKELATGATFDAALVDLSPLGDSAAHAISELRGSNPEMAVILISGVASGAPDAVAHQVVAWVRKPFEMGEILDVLSGTLKCASESSSTLRA
jgi:ActR/RegA family two-component response regulator